MYLKINSTVPTSLIRPPLHGRGVVSHKCPSDRREVSKLSQIHSQNFVKCLLLMCNTDITLCTRGAHSPQQYSLQVNKATVCTSRHVVPNNSHV